VDQNNFTSIVASHISKMNTNAKNLFLIQNGFDSFQNKYPFLCVSFSSQGASLVDAMMSHPFEIVPNFLFLGDIQHGRNQKQISDLKITKVINVSGVALLYPKEIQIFEPEFEIKEDQEEIVVPIAETMKFIAKGKLEDRILIFDFDGKVKGPILAAAYLLHDAKRIGKKINALYAWGLLEQCKSTLKITSNYFKYLKLYEEELYDEKTIHLERERDDKMDMGSVD
jgi:hypothetical protein